MDDIHNIRTPVTRSPATKAVQDEAANPEDAEKDRKLRKACADFEAIFISYLFQTMRKTVPESSYMTKMPGKDTYTMIMDQKLSQEMAQRGGGIGIQKLLYEQMKRTPSKMPQLEENGAEADTAMKKTLKIE